MPRLIYSKEKILADWKTGKYSIRALAKEHNVSPGTIHNITKNVEKSLEGIINEQVAINQQLAQLPEHELNTFKSEVDSRTRNLTWLDNATMKNLNVMMKKVNETLPVKEHRDVQAAIKDGKETMYGKSPDTIINNTNAQQVQVDIASLKAARARVIDEY